MGGTGLPVDVVIRGTSVVALGDNVDNLSDGAPVGDIDDDVVSPDKDDVSVLKDEEGVASGGGTVGG
jgi:hypothetical protein